MVGFDVKIRSPVFGAPQLCWWRGIRHRFMVPRNVVGGGLIVPKLSETIRIFFPIYR